MFANYKYNNECPFLIITLKSAVTLSFRRNLNTLKMNQFRFFQNDKQTAKY